MVSSSIVSFTIPDLLKNGDPETVKSLYPEDVIERAQSILKHIGSIGAYSHSQGASYFRQSIAEFITNRDGGYVSHANNIFNFRASTAVSYLLQILSVNETPGS